MEGIYCIEHIESGRKYYGSSMNVIKRLKQHRTDLVKQKHHNIQLQRAIDIPCLSNFKFYLIEETQFNNRPLLLKLEQNYLDKNSNGYNMAPANGGDILSMHPDKILIRERIKESHKQTLSVLSTNERKLKFGRDARRMEIGKMEEFVTSYALYVLHLRYLLSRRIVVNVGSGLKKIIHFTISTIQKKLNNC